MMKKMLKKGIIILGVYTFLTLCLFAVSERIERLDDTSSLEKTGVAISISSK